MSRPPWGGCLDLLRRRRLRVLLGTGSTTPRRRTKTQTTTARRDWSSQKASTGSSKLSNGLKQGLPCGLRWIGAAEKPGGLPCLAASRLWVFQDRPRDKGQEHVPPGRLTDCHQLGYTKASAELGGEAP